MSGSPWKQRPDYQRILFPTDGSRDARVALLELVPLALSTGATVVVLEVVPTGDDDARSAAMDRQRGARRQLEQAGIAGVECVVEHGQPGPAIVAAAEERECDVIVMATHGRTGLPRALLGSVAEHVLRHAPCPILLVPATTRRRSGASVPGAPQ
ncbi:MAG: universal stress protein [Dehalococcoidia bacterium]|nr:universal stress protein [Myxococcales bacterium]MCA9851061.1 universal stress protein [Dehalococcoidia bacterium]